jgi:hydroxyacylglutathione hydrolase
VIAPQAERAFIEEARDGITPAVVDRGVADGETVQVGGLTLTAHCIPSHSEAITAYRVDLADRRALFAGDIVFINGIIGLINYPGSDLAAYRANLGRLAGLGIDALLPGHLLFTLGDGQRHIDAAIQHLNEGFVPYSIGQSAVSFMPSNRFGV